FRARFRALRGRPPDAYRPRGPHDARDGTHLSCERGRAAGPQRPVEGPHARAVLRRARVALRLENGELSGKLMDSRLRGNDEATGWIPACAGMTKLDSRLRGNDEAGFPPARE